MRFIKLTITLAVPVLSFVLIFFVAEANTINPNKIIRLATYTYAANSRTENLMPLAQLIKKKTGLEVQVLSYPNVEEFIKAIQTDKVDIALISTMGYFLLNNGKTGHQMEVSYTLSVPSNASTLYKTSFVVPKNSKFNSISDVIANTNLNICLVSRGSTSGNLIPRLIFAENGVTSLETKFKNVKYSQTHHAAIESVINGDADMAAMGSSAYYEYIKANKSRAAIKLIHLSPDIPLGPVLVNRKLNNDLKQLLDKMFVSMHAKEKQTLDAIKNGWTEAKSAKRFIAIDSTYYSRAFDKFDRAAEVIEMLIR